MEPRSRFQAMNSSSLRNLAGRYYNPIPTRFLAPIDCLKIPALRHHLRNCCKFLEKITLGRRDFLIVFFAVYISFELSGVTACLPHSWLFKNQRFLQRVLQRHLDLNIDWTLLCRVPCFSLFLQKWRKKTRKQIINWIVGHLIRTFYTSF